MGCWLKRTLSVILTLGLFEFSTQSCSYEDLRYTDSYVRPYGMSYSRFHSSSSYGASSHSDRVVLCEGMNSSSNFQKDIEILGITSYRHDLHYLEFNKSNIPELPTGFLRSSDITNIRLNNANIRIIQVDAFKGLQKLTHLYLKNNQVGSLKESTFKDLIDLNTLDLSNNQIAAVEEKSFADLGNLTQLYLQNNSLVSLPPNLFANMENLETLDLSYNKIEIINPDTFKHLTDLETLWLNDNRLVALDKNIVASNEALEKFYIQFNFITRLELSLSNSCLVLNSSNNALTGITPETIVNVQTLDLSTNELKALDSLPDMLTNELYLNNNLLGEHGLQGDTFDHFKLLKVLSLNSNGIKSLNGSVFKNNQALEKLSLVNNSISYLDTSKFPASILELNLSTSAITSLANLSDLKNLTLLDLSFNKLAEVPLHMFDGLKKLKTLLLNNNNIAKLKLGCFKHLGILNRLYLSNNQILKLEVGVFAGLNYLSFLDLSYNKLTTLDEGVFHSFKNLHGLDFSHNNISYFNAKNTLSHFMWPIEVNLADNNWSCQFLSTIIRDHRSIRLKDGQDNEVTNVRGVACRNEKPEQDVDQKSPATYPKIFDSINSKLSTSNTVLVLILIVVIVKLILKYAVRYLKKFTLNPGKTEQEMQLIP